MCSTPQPSHTRDSTTGQTEFPAGDQRCAGSSLLDPALDPALDPVPDPPGSATCTGGCTTAAWACYRGQDVAQVLPELGISAKS